MTIMAGNANFYRDNSPKGPNGVMSRWISVQFPFDYAGYCIDVGASDGILCNSTYMLEQQYGWTVVSCEPNPCFWPSLGRFRKHVEPVAVSSQFGNEVPFYVNPDNPEAYSSLVLPDGKKWPSIKVKCRTLASILGKHGFPRLDALCIDTEGTELDVLKSLDLKKWKPKVIVCESWDENGPILDYLRDFGYERVERRYHNDMMVRSDD